MDNIEEIINTKIKNGWRAIIYDAPWATFKQNQDGVIITPDGRACETTDDSKDSIIIIVDSNILPVKRENGHILFRQKGSDLFDIVCLYQEEGEEVSLIIEDMNGNVGSVTIDGCNGTFTDFKNKLVVYETIGGTKGRQLKKDEYDILAPSSQYFYDNVPNDSEEPKETDIIISYIKYSKYISPVTGGVLTITTKDEIQENIDKSTSTIDLSNIYAERKSNASYLYSIKRKPNTDTPCTGGAVEFSLEKTLIEDPKYLIHINGVEVITTYAIVSTQCGEEIGRRNEQKVDNDIIFTIKGNVSNIKNEENGDISLTISDSVSYFIIIAENGVGIKSEITLFRDYTDGNFKSQINNL